MDQEHDFVTVGLTDTRWCIKCGEEDHVIEKLGTKCKTNERNGMIVYGLFPNSEIEKLSADVIDALNRRTFDKMREEIDKIEESMRIAASVEVNEEIRPSKQ